MTMKLLFQTMALPTGGLSNCRCSSIQACRLNGANWDMATPSREVRDDPDPMDLAVAPGRAVGHSSPCFNLSRAAELGNRNSSGSEAKSVCVIRQHGESSCLHPERG